MKYSLKELQTFSTDELLNFCLDKKYIPTLSFNPNYGYWFCSLVSFEEFDCTFSEDVVEYDGLNPKDAILDCMKHLKLLRS